MTDKEKIRAFIERLHKEHRGGAGDSIFRRALRTVLHYIDSIQEESASENLEKEIQRYTEQKKLSDVRFLVPGIARHFANWQKQQMMKNCLDYTIMKAQYCDEHLPPLKDLATLPLIRFSPAKLLERGLKVGDKVKVIIIKED